MPCPTDLSRLCIFFSLLSASFVTTSLVTWKRRETGTFHSFTYVYSDIGCFEASFRMVYCAAFGCNANSCKNRVTCRSFKCPKQQTLLQNCSRKRSHQTSSRRSTNLFRPRSGEDGSHNSLLTNIAKRDLAKLQRVQHCLASVVFRAPQFSPSLSLLKQLHWLPVTYRINFKLSTLTYRALSTQQPPDLTSFLHLSNIPRQLMPSISQQLIVPKKT